MLFRIKRTLARAWFDLNTRALLQTPVLIQNDDATTIVSMVCHGEVRMYLLAVKSFCAMLGRNPKVVVLDDGSLDEADRVLISKHLPGSRVVHIQQVKHDRCPKGGCWERLLLISDLVKETYVVQLDSDTISRHPLHEVDKCITSNRSFTLLGDGSHPAIESMAAATERLRGGKSLMVQAICERSFGKLTENVSLQYVRGNAGFTGFAKGSIDRQKVIWFSDLMRGLAKEKWDDWGSEQVTSNLLIANTAGSHVLPFPQYLSYWDHVGVPYKDATFIHFIGPHRFSNNFYVESAKKVIQKLHHA